MRGQSTNILSYCTVGYFVFKKKNLFHRLAVHTMLLYLLCFSCLMRNEQKHLAGKKQLDNK